MRGRAIKAPPTQLPIKLGMNCGVFHVRHARKRGDEQDSRISRDRSQSICRRRASWIEEWKTCWQRRGRRKDCRDQVS